MDQPDNLKAKAALATANQHFKERNFALAREKLQEIKTPHLSIELDLLLIQYKENSKNGSAILKKMMDILTGINIKLYNQLPKHHQKRLSKEQNPIAFINHEFFFWNIIVVAQQQSRIQIPLLIGKEALEYYRSLRTETALMIIYQMLKMMVGENRIASCISLAEKSNKIIGHLKNLSKSEQQYRAMNQILSTKVFLKLGMVEAAQTIYMMKLGESQEELFKEISASNNLNCIPFKFYQELLHAEIEFSSKNYSQSLKILSNLMGLIEQLKPRDKQLIRHIVDNNIGLILSVSGQHTIGKMLINRSAHGIFNLKDNAHKDSVQKDNEKCLLINRSKENLMYAGLMEENANPNYSNKQEIYDMLEHYPNSYSFKVNYRKAQCCLNYYHHLLKFNQKILPWADIHDQHEPTYFYPNLPYFQQKGRNKNPNYTNGKHFYRRYVLNQWDKQINLTQNSNIFAEVLQDVVSQNQSKDKKEQRGNGQSTNHYKGKKCKEEEEDKPKMAEIKQNKEGLEINDKNHKFQMKAKLKSILQQAQNYLKQSLLILEEEKKVIIHFNGEEQGMSNQVNQKLYSEYVDFKSSIYTLLCYIFVCKCEWLKVIHYAAEFKKFQGLSIHQSKPKSPQQKECYYSILSYEMQASCQLNKIKDAYQVMHNIISLGYGQQKVIQARSTINQNPGECYFQQTNHYNNLLYNISVLHSRDNRIVQSHQAIQKMLSHMRLVPSSSQADIPLCLVDLLIHYNLRTYNYSSAIQMIKRKRILQIQGLAAHGVYPTLSITK